MGTINSPRIDAYRFGQITIDGKRYHQDVIILPDRIIDHWHRKKGHYLQTVDLDEVMTEKPEILVVGQGVYGRMRISEEIHGALTSQEIELIALTSSEACDKYNELSRERRTIAAIHLTC